MSHKTAILIPYYNGEKYIEKCIASLDCEHKDIWIIDNSENSYEFDSELNHIVTKTKKLGFAKAVNLGMDLLLKAGYKHAIILNQDAYFQESHFGIFVEELQKNEEDFLCPLLYTEEFLEVIPFVRERYFSLGVPKSNTNIKDYVGVVIGCSLGLWKELGGLDEDFFMYFEENDLFRRSKKELPILLTPNVHVAHRNKEEKMEEESLDWFYRSEILYAKKHESFMRQMILRVKYYLRRRYKN